jgi:hypothetical protein
MVIMWQILLGGVIVLSRIFGRYYTGVAWILAIGWTGSHTHGDLQSFQMIVQSIIAGVILILPDAAISRFFEDKQPLDETKKYEKIRQEKPDSIIEVGEKSDFTIAEAEKLIPSAKLPFHQSAFSCLVMLFGIIACVFGPFMIARALW